MGVQKVSRWPEDKLNQSGKTVLYWQQPSSETQVRNVVQTGAQKIVDTLSTKRRNRARLFWKVDVKKRREVKEPEWVVGKAGGGNRWSLDTKRPKDSQKSGQR